MRKRRRATKRPARRARARARASAKLAAPAARARAPAVPICIARAESASTHATRSSTTDLKSLAAGPRSGRLRFKLALQTEKRLASIRSGVVRGNAMHGFTAAAARPGIIDIPKAEHTYQPFLLGVDDGKAPHPFALHN